MVLNYLKDIDYRRLYTDIKLMRIHVNDAFFKNSFFISLSSLFNAACGFFFWTLAAKLYSVEDVGLATAMLSSVTLLILLSRFGFDISIIRFYSSNIEKNVFNTSIMVTTFFSIIVTLIYIKFVYIISPNLNFAKSVIYSLIFLFTVIFMSFAMISSNALIASKMSKYYFYQNIMMGMRVLLLMPFVFLGYMGIFISTGISTLFAALWTLYIFKKIQNSIDLKINFQFIKESINFSLWNYISGILANSPSQIMPLIMINMLGEAATAKYYIIFAASNLVLIIPNAISTSLLVEGSSGFALKNNIIRASIATFSLLIPIVSIIFIFGKNILDLVGDGYTDSLFLLRIFTASSFLVAAYYIYVAIQNIRMNARSIAEINLLRFILLLGLSPILISSYGINGAGYAWMLAHGFIILLIAIIEMRAKWVMSLQ